MDNILFFSALFLLTYVILVGLHQCSMENSFLDFIAGDGICSGLDDGVGNLSLLAIFSSLFYNFIIR